MGIVGDPSSEGNGTSRFRGDKYWRGDEPVRIDEISKNWDDLSGPDKEWKTMAAIYGLELKPVGLTYEFHTVFSQLLEFTRPKLSDYQPFLDSLGMKCQEFEQTFKVPENATEQLIKLYNQTNLALEEYNKLFLDRCQNFVDAVRNVTTERVRLAFEESHDQALSEVDALIQRALSYAEKQIKLPDMNFLASRKEIQLREYFTGNISSDPSFFEPIVQEVRDRLYSSNSVLSDRYEIPSTSSTTTSTLSPSSTKPTKTTQRPTTTQRTTTTQSTTTTQATTTQSSTTPSSTTQRVTSSTPTSTARSFSEPIVSGNMQSRGTGGLGRRKRQFDVVSFSVAAGAAVTAGLAMAASGTALYQISNLQSKVDELFAMRVNSDEHSIYVAKNFLGITSINKEHAGRVVSGVSQVVVIQDILGKEIEKASMFVSKFSLENKLANTVLSNLIHELELTSRVQFVVNDLKIQMANYQMAMLSLRSGHLSPQLISYQKLKEVLRGLEQSLPKDLFLAIPYSEIDRYYSMKLTKFFSVEDKIMVHLLVPLSRTEVTKPDKLFEVIRHPIPVVHKWKTIDQVARLPGAKMLLDNRPGYWVFRGTEMLGIADNSRLNCRAIGNERECFSFDLHPQEGHTACTRAFVDGSFDHVLTHCMFVPVQSPYLPIPVGNGSVMAHYFKGITYREKCGERMRTLMDTQYAQLFNIPVGCSLLVNEETVPVWTPGETESYSTIIPGVLPPVGQRPQIEEIKVEGIELFIYNRTEHIHLALDTEEIDRRTKNIKRSIRSLQDNLVQKIKKYRFSFTGNRFMTLKTLDNFIFDFLVLLMAIVLIRRMKLPFFYMFLAPKLVIIPCPVETFEMNETTTPIPSTTEALDVITEQPPSEEKTSFFVTEYEAEDYMALLRLSILLLAACALLTRRYFFVTEISTLRGALQFPNSYRFHITLYFKVAHHGILKFSDQLCMIVIPVAVPIPPTTIMCVLTRNLAMFSVNHRTGHFSLTEPLIVRGIDNTGAWSFSSRQRIQFSLSSVTWLGGPDPVGFHKTFYGKAYISVTGDPRPVARGAGTMSVTAV